MSHTASSLAALAAAVLLAAAVIAPSPAVTAKTKVAPMPDACAHVAPFAAEGLPPVPAITRAARELRRGRAKSAARAFDKLYRRLVSEAERLFGSEKPPRSRRGARQFLDRWVLAERPALHVRGETFALAPDLYRLGVAAHCRSGRRDRAALLARRAAREWPGAGTTLDLAAAELARGDRARTRKTLDGLTEQLSAADRTRRDALRVFLGSGD